MTVHEFIDRTSKQEKTSVHSLTPSELMTLVVIALGAWAGVRRPADRRSLPNQMPSSSTCAPLCRSPLQTMVGPRTEDVDKVTLFIDEHAQCTKTIMYAGMLVASVILVFPFYTTCYGQPSTFGRFAWQWRSLVINCTSAFAVKQAYDGEAHSLEAASLVCISWFCTFTAHPPMLKNWLVNAGSEEYVRSDAPDGVFWPRFRNILLFDGDLSIRDECRCACNGR
jgi:hypothetical protein